MIRLERWGFSTIWTNFGSVVVAAPFVTYQVWRFIAPGLYAKENDSRFPSMIGFFQAFHVRRVTFMPRVEDTFELYKNTLIAMVAVFQIPTLAFFLAKMRMVTARFLWRNFKYASLIIFIVAAVLTPSPDPW